MAKENLKERMISGALSLTAATIIVKILGVLYKIPLAGILGDEGMGYFNSAYTVYGFFYILCTAGVPKSVMILISESDETGRGERAEHILKTAVKAFSFIGILLSLALAVFAVPLAKLIGSSESSVTMICIAPSIVFASVAGVLRGYLSADMRLLSVAASQVLEGAVKLAAGLIFAIIGIKLNLPIYYISALTISGATLGSFVGLVQLLISSKSRKKDIISGQNYNDGKEKGIIKRIFKVSLPITVSAALMSISGICDLFLIMKRLGAIGYSEAEATALYGNYTTLAVSMFNLAVSLIAPISVAFVPILTRAKAAGERESFFGSIKSALEFSSLLTAPIVLGIGLFAKEILSLLFGSTAAEAGAPLLMLLSPAIIFMSFILILNSSLEAVGRPGLAMLSMTVGVAVKMIVSGILIGNPNIGISGAPLGTVISYAVSAFISLLILSHILGYNIPVLSTAVLPYLTASVSVMLARIIYDSIKYSMQGALSLAVSVLCAVGIYLGLSVLFAFSEKEKITKMAKFTKFG